MGPQTVLLVFMNEWSAYPISRTIRDSPILVMGKMSYKEAIVSITDIGIQNLCSGLSMEIGSFL